MIESTELCPYCGLEFDYEAEDADGLVQCPYCNSLLKQCNLCDMDYAQCADCYVNVELNIKQRKGE